MKRLLVLLALLGALPAAAEVVTTPFRGLTLNANFEKPASPRGKSVFLVVHGTMAHRGMEIIAALQKLLKERGYPSLAINLGLGVDNRTGMLDCAVTHRHRQDDALDEIGAWIAWLKQQGHGDVILLGHSRGGAQAAAYAAERDGPGLRAVVLLAPAQRGDAAGYERRHKQALAPIVEKAKALVAGGKPQALLAGTGFHHCEGARVTAESFLSYYGPDAKTHAPEYIPRIAKPTFLVVAGADEVFPNQRETLAPLADGKRVSMKVIDGSDHFFRDLSADDAMDAIEAFLEEKGPL